MSRTLRNILIAVGVLVVILIVVPFLIRSEEHTSKHPSTYDNIRKKELTGGASRNRTDDLGVRSASLYASELRPRGSHYSGKNGMTVLRRGLRPLQSLFDDRVVLSASPPHFDPLETGLAAEP